MTASFQELDDGHVRLVPLPPASIDEVVAVARAVARRVHRRLQSEAAREPVLDNGASAATIGADCVELTLHYRVP